MVDSKLIELIRSYKQIPFSDFKLPAPGDYINLQLNGEEHSKFNIHIRRDENSLTLSLAEKWDFGLRTDDNKHLLRIDYGDDAVHRAKDCQITGPHLHVGNQCLTFPEVNEYFEDIVDPTLVYNQDADIITAVRGFLLACGVDYNEVNNLEIR